MKQGCRRREYFRPGSVRVFVLGGVALLLAGWVVYGWLRPDGPPGDGPSTIFLCENCQEFFALSAVELEAQMNDGRARREMIGAPLQFSCPKCGQAKGVRASRCPEHGDVVRKHTGEGEPPRCSKCDFTG